MTKQDRRDKKAKEGRSKADEIIAATYAKVKANADVQVDETKWDRPEGCDPETWLLACAVRTQRDAGVPWWQIAHSLGLPGSADNVAQGKSGASFARKVYRSGFGEVPRVQRKRLPGKAEHGVVKAIRSQSRVERIEAVRAGVSVVPQDLPDEEVVAMFKGRSIAWTINLHDHDEGGDLWKEETADVHRFMVRAETDARGERVLRFKEVDRSGPVRWREMGLSTRVVRLRSIHAVR